MATTLRKQWLLYVLAALTLSGCVNLFGASNTITTTQVLDPNTQQVIEVITVEELSDDALYYKTAKEVMLKDATSSCSPNCAPGEAGIIEMSRTLRYVMGKGFVERGMNGYELTRDLGTAAISAAPLGVGMYYLGKVSSKPSSVNFNGSDNEYNYTEGHWTGNDINDGNTWTIPFKTSESTEMVGE